MKTSATQKLAERQPVVAVMGHIDHGKSTLLDTIRRTNIVAKEAGGITQHIAAYEVTHKAKSGKENTITFLDTPGHAAFKGIRIRSANVADIAILIVSAEEGVKPQTVEALTQIKSSGIPYVVGINKIDSPKANLERTKQSLAENEIYIEGYGGDIPWAAISAKTGEGIPELLDLILLVAEMNTFTCTPDKAAEGAVIEANLDPKKGISATLIIKDGTLQKGETVICGDSTAPVRIMENFAGKQISEALPGRPVRLVGFSSLPPIGELFFTFKTKKEAEAYIEKVQLEAKKIGGKKIAEQAPVDVSTLVVPIVIKADVAGTLEAIMSELKKLPQDKVKLKIIQSGIGEVSEGDVKILVGQTNPIVLSFGVKISPAAKNLSERALITMHSFDIIYKLVEWAEAFIKENTPKQFADQVTGSAKILKIFSKNKDKQVVGGRVQNGMIVVGANVRIMRREAKIGEGKIRELQQQKNKATEAKKDSEFGTLIESKVEIAPGDTIESITSVEI